MAAARRGSLDNPMQARLAELESRLAFQEHTLENLNQVVTRQDREILELKKQLAGLTSRLKEFENVIAAADPAEIPPHY